MKNISRKNLIISRQRKKEKQGFVFIHMYEHKALLLYMPIYEVLIF